MPCATHRTPALRALHPQMDQPEARRARPDAGFTLVEALIAIVILVFGLMGVMNLLLIASSSNTVANQHTAAATVAAQYLEVLKARPFNVLAPSPADALTSDQTGYFADDEIPGVGRIHTRWEVTPVDGDASILYIRVRSEGTGRLTGARSRAEYTTFRVCAVRAAPYNCP